MSLDLSKYIFLLNEFWFSPHLDVWHHIEPINNIYSYVLHIFIFLFSGCFRLVSFSLSNWIFDLGIIVSIYGLEMKTQIA